MSIHNKLAVYWQTTDRTKGDFIEKLKQYFLNWEIFLIKYLSIRKVLMLAPCLQITRMFFCHLITILRGFVSGKAII